MSTVQTLEQQIANINMPETDIHDKVMESISSTQLQKKHPVNTKLLIAASISILLILGSGFASFQYIILYNDKGEQTLNIQPYSSTEKSPDYPKQYLDLIAEGEAIAIYDPNNNDNKLITVSSKAKTYNDWNTFINDVENSYPIPTTLPDSYTFISGTIAYAAKFPDTDKLIQESVDNGHIITYEKVDTYDKIAHITITLTKQDHQYIVSMNEGQTTDTLFTDHINSPKVQKININGVEAFVATKASETNVIWRSSKEDGDNIYSISTTNTSSDVNEEIKAILLMFIQLD